MLLAALSAGFFAAGCASTGLPSARSNYYQGRYQQAADDLAEKSPSNKDKVLFLMERGMIRQAAGDFEGSSSDLIEAYDILERTAAVSLSKDTASLVINDNVQTYQGAPFERTLLHVFTAKNHLLRNDWENAAVEARRIIESLKPENRKDYPEDAYSRYMAGFCLGLIGDWSNAALQYRNADALLPYLTIDDRTGLIYPGTNMVNSSAANQSGLTHELVVFTLIGRSPTGHELQNARRPILPAGFASIVIDGQHTGRSYSLSDTVDLAFTTKQKDAIREMAKSVGRIAAKEAAARSIEQEDELLGFLFRAIMIGLLEQPDTRRWETLPRSLQVARIPCPENPKDIEIRFQTSSGVTTRTLHAGPDLIRHNNTYILVVRDSQPVL